MQPIAIAIAAMQAPSAFLGRAPPCPGWVLEEFEGTPQPGGASPLWVWPSVFPWAFWGAVMLRSSRQKVGALGVIGRHTPQIPVLFPGALPGPRPLVSCCVIVSLIHKQPHGAGGVRWEFHWGLLTCTPGDTFLPSTMLFPPGLSFGALPSPSHGPAHQVRPYTHTVLRASCIICGPQSKFFF